MASSYPGGLDNFSTGHTDNSNEIIHASTINDNADAINKIEAELGTNPKGSAADVKTRIANTETVANAAVPKSTVTTKGDLIAATGSGAVTRLGVGTNTQVLTADSSQSTGMKWAPVSAGSTSPLTTKGDIWGFSTVDARIPVGANGDVLTADSTQALGVKWAPASGGSGSGTGQESLDTIAASGSALTVNYANGAVQDITLTANCTFTLSSPPSGSSQALTLFLRQDGTGGRSVTWPGAVTWIGGVTPTLHSAPSAFDVITLFTVDGGTTWYGAQAVSPAPSFAFAEVLSLGSESTSSSSYTDLTTPGPAATITVGASGIALVGWNVQTGSNSAFMSVALSGANTVAASDNWGLGSVPLMGGRTYVFTGLTPGSTTFTAKYRAGAGTVAFLRRTLWAQAI